MHRSLNGYDVGALLYCPANSKASIVDSLVSEKFGRPFSLAFCLEDTVRENAVEEAEQELYRTLSEIVQAKQEQNFYLPLIFIRVRSPEQMRKLADVYGTFSSVLTGFILPKFFIHNCDAYISVIQDIRRQTPYDYYYMPIFESNEMIDLRTRYEHLTVVKEKLEAVADRILNIRVGGNDLCHAFGLRRHTDNTIYDVAPVANLLIDIVTTFATRYVVSGPVWEYFSGTGWDSGLKKELELDLLSGFVGKTVIHPSQIDVVNKALQVEKADYNDAVKILNWNDADARLVSSSTQSSRMNEYNTHFNWAKRILCMARVYGVKEDRT